MMIVMMTIRRVKINKHKNQDSFFFPLSLAFAIFYYIHFDGTVYILSLSICSCGQKATIQDPKHEEK